MSGAEERILILAPFGRDAPLAQKALAEAGMPAILCGGVPELCVRLGEPSGAVLLTEEVVGAPGFAEVLALLRRQPAWSDLPIVIFGSADHKLGEWANVTLLDRPVRIRTLVSALRAALRARRRQYQARDMMRALEQSVRDRDQFLAMLGHELRNPLAAILTSSELLDSKRVQGIDRERAVIGRQARRLSRLVDDLLEVSRVTAGKIPLRSEPVELRALVRGTVQSHEAAARSQRVELLLETGDVAVPVLGDPLRLEQIAGNLLGNAIKYTPAGGRVTIQVRSEGAEAILRVRDTGVGIGPEVLPRVFDLFIQEPGSIDRSQGGMGIGLTLVKRLVELHEGSVRASSAGRGRGSELEVRLPLSSSREEYAGGPGTAAPGARTVLLVEDNADSRDVLELALSRLGHRVSSCGDGIAGIEQALRERPQVLIVDLGLPGRSGYEVAAAVRKALGAQVRLVALSGYGQPADKERAQAAGFDEFLTKPAELSDLDRAIARAPA